MSTELKAIPEHDGSPDLSLTRFNGGEAGLKLQLTQSNKLQSTGGFVQLTKGQAALLRVRLEHFIDGSDEELLKNFDVNEDLEERIADLEWKVNNLEGNRS